MCYPHVVIRAGWLSRHAFVMPSLYVYYDLYAWHAQMLSPNLRACNGYLVHACPLYCMAMISLEKK